jgi:2-polyprenyl-3-methyl-5-hydroxy-6-metoxy-1,4-benzoquinol methylase
MNRDRPSQEVVEGCLLCGTVGAAPWIESTVQLAPATGERFRFVRCRECDLVFLSPRPTEAGMARYYPPDYLPHRGPEAWGRWAPIARRSERALDRRRVRRVLSRTGVGPAHSILDVGCGRPTFLKEFRRRTGARCVGLDVSAAGWEEGSDPERWEGLTLLEGTPAALSERLRELSSDPGEAIASPGFDCITMWHALEHDHHPLETLRILASIAAPDARLFVEVPDLDSLTSRLHGEDWAGLHTPRHTAAYTSETLQGMLEAGGWSVEGAHRHGTLSPWVLWWLGRQVRAGRALDGSLEPAFPSFVGGMVAALPLIVLQRWIPLGVQLVEARLRG